MKKHLLVFVAVLLAVAIAMPAFAAVEFKYGGQWRNRVVNEDNVRDGTELNGYYGPGYNSDDNRFFLDQRLRLYFTFAASKNLKVVTKFEIGDVIWGDPNNAGVRTGPGSGGNVGADAVNLETKNAYVEFNIPNTPSTAILGIQTLMLLDSWIVDDDFSAAVLVTKLDPFKVTLGYVAGQNGFTNSSGSIGLKYTQQNANVDSMFAAVDYAQGPFKASGIFFWQNGHNSTVSMDPATLNTPVTSYTGTAGNFMNQALIDSNNLFDLGFNLTYKTDWLLAYVNFVKNLGSVDYKANLPVIQNQALTGWQSSSDYTGFMVDAGVTYFCGPYTFNIGGFYTSGPDLSNDVRYYAPVPQGNSATAINNTLPFPGTNSKDINWFTYPLATSKYFSEIIGGGVLGDDIYVTRGYTNSSAFPYNGAGQIGSNSKMSTVFWRGYSFPTNLWTITAGGSWQVAEKTKISASYWYFGTAESVPVAFKTLGGTELSMSSSIGHELDFYVDQGIVDGLTLTLVGAYLIADDAFCPLPIGASNAQSIYTASQADNAYKLGARLQWNF